MRRVAHEDAERRCTPTRSSLPLRPPDGPPRTVGGAGGPRWFLLPLLLLAPLLLAACDIPRDPRGTLSEVRGGELRVGVAANPPWVAFAEGTGATPERDDGGPSGVEVELVRAFADELGAEVRFVRGALPELTEALSFAQLHLVVGGVTMATPGTAHAARTNVYLKEALRTAAPPGEDPAALEGQRVRVQYGSIASAPLEERGAEIEPVEELPSANRAAEEGVWVAAPEWLLALHGYPVDGPKLAEHHRVMLTIPGENGFLTRLERFLHARRPSLEERFGVAPGGGGS